MFLFSFCDHVFSLWSMCIICQLFIYCCEGKCWRFWLQRLAKFPAFGILLLIKMCPNLEFSISPVSIPAQLFILSIPQTLFFHPHVLVLWYGISLQSNYGVLCHLLPVHPFHIHLQSKMTFTDSVNQMCQSCAYIINS